MKRSTVCALMLLTLPAVGWAGEKPCVHGHTDFEVEAARAMARLGPCELMAVTRQNFQWMAEQDLARYNQGPYGVRAATQPRFSRPLPSAPMPIH